MDLSIWSSVLTASIIQKIGCSRKKGAQHFFRIFCIFFRNFFSASKQQRGSVAINYAENFPHPEKLSAEKTDFFPPSYPSKSVSVPMVCQARNERIFKTQLGS